jgi:predicted dehydrogenase
MGDPIGFGVIGCGAAAWIGHLPWIWEHPDARLVVACDPDRSRAAAVQERYQVPAIATDYREVLSLPGVEAVVICTPPSSHAEIATAAARRGKHILLEKPMARSVAECDEIAAAVRQHGVALMVGHTKRFQIACERIRSLIAEGTLGRVFYLDVHWGASVKLAPDRLIPEGFRDSYAWRWKAPSVGGGILQDHLPHYIDLWRWWTGAEVETVSAEVLNVARDYLGESEIGLWEDFGTVLLRFTDGAVGLFQTSTVGRGLSPILHQGSGLGEWSEFGSLYGTRGQLAFDFLPWDSPEHGRLMVWSLEGRGERDRGWYQVELPEPRRCPGGPRSPATNETFMFRRQLDRFLRCLRSGTEPQPGAGDGRATLAVIEAVYESGRTGQKVRVQN